MRTRTVFGAAAGMLLSAVVSVGLAAPTLLVNGEFDVDVAGWEATLERTELVWLPIDASGSSTSGALGVTNRETISTPGTFAGSPAVQCVPIEPERRYLFSVFVTVPADQPLAPGPRASIRLQFSPSNNCTFGGTSPDPVISTLPQAASPGEWSQLLLGAWAPPWAKSAHLSLSSWKGQTPDSFTVAFDEVTFTGFPRSATVPMIAASGN